MVAGETAAGEHPALVIRDFTRTVRTCRVDLILKSDDQHFFTGHRPVFGRIRPCLMGKMLIAGRESDINTDISFFVLID